MNTTLLLGSTVAMTILVSCKQAAGFRDPAPTGAGKPSEAQVASAQAKSPKMLLARVKLSEINQPKSRVEWVSSDQQMKVTNGDQAAQAFAAGQPMQIVQSIRGPQAVNANYQIALTATNVVSPKQMGLDDVVLGYPTSYGPYPGGYGSGAGYNPYTPVTYNNGGSTYPTYNTPYGGVGSTYPYGGAGSAYGAGGYGAGGYGAEGGGYGYGAGGYGSSIGNIFSAAGGFLSYVGAMIEGFSYTVGSLMSVLNPFNWLGNIGVGYGSTGGYQEGGYQYYPYSQNPSGPVIGGQYPNQIPQPYYPNQQYPNQQYPNQPTVPTAPTGQEQMPQI